MSNPNFDDDEKPLDPSVRRVEVRVRRLILIAGLTLGVGLIAVFGAILYRIGGVGTTAQTSPPPPATAEHRLTLAEMGLPAGAKLVSTALDGNRAALTYQTDSGTVTVVVDLAAGAVVGRLTVASP